MNPGKFLRKMEGEEEGNKLKKNSAIICRYILLCGNQLNVLSLRQ